MTIRAATKPDFTDVIARAEELGRRFALTAVTMMKRVSFRLRISMRFMMLAALPRHGRQPWRPGWGADRRWRWFPPSPGRTLTAPCAVDALQPAFFGPASGKWPQHLVERVTKANREGVALINAAQVEPRVGSPSHGKPPETIARRVGNQWRITGHRPIATGIPLLRWVSVLAVTDEPEPRLGSFLVPASAEGIRVEKTWNATGMGPRVATISFWRMWRCAGRCVGHRPASEGLKRDERIGSWFFSCGAGGLRRRGTRSPRLAP